MTPGDDEIPGVPGALVLHLGGTRELVALVTGAKVREARRLVRGRGGEHGWLSALATAIAPWRGAYCAATVVGNAPDAVALELAGLLRLPVGVLRETEAAAWAEHQFGVAAGADAVYLHLGDAVDGAIITGGRLAHAGRLGRMRLGSVPGAPALEDVVNTTALMRRAAGTGARDVDALFAAARTGRLAARDALDAMAEAVGAACLSIQALLDPPMIVLAGGIGRGQGFAERVSAALAGQSDRLQPDLRPARFGAEAALIGAAGHAVELLSAR